MLVSAFLCPNFKIEEREVWELTIDSSPWQELVGGGITAEKPKCQVSGDIRKVSGGRKETGKTKTSAGEGGGQ